MKKIITLMLVFCFGILTLASCGKKTEPSTSSAVPAQIVRVQAMEVEGSLVKEATVTKLNKLNLLSYNVNLNALEDETTTSGEATPSTSSAEVSSATSETVVEKTVNNAVLNNTNEFEITIKVDNPTDNSIHQLKFDVEGDVEIKNENGVMTPFEDYNHGVVNWTAQNASKAKFVFSTEGDAIVKIVGIRLVGETEWQTENLGYNQLNIYKVDDIVEFVSNEYNTGYTFKTKAIEGVNVTAVTTTKAETVGSNTEYTMIENGNIVIDYDLKITDELTLHCEQRKEIKLISFDYDTPTVLSVEPNVEFSVKTVISNINVGTDNLAEKAEEFNFALTDGINVWALTRIQPYNGDYHYAYINGIPSDYNLSKLRVIII